MNYTIITGSSRGLGQAIATQLLTKEAQTLICISRSENEELKQAAAEHSIDYHFYSADLSNVATLPALMDEIFTTIQLDEAKQIHLINNAGLLAPARPLERVESDELQKNLNVNLAAPMLLTAEFLKHTASSPADKRIINVSSGAGQRPIYGWSCYGAAKAGLDLFSRNVAVEQAEAAYPAKICSFGPGIMDTAMQGEIRSIDKNDFIHVDTFRRYKEEGKLLSPDQVAKVIIDLLETNDFPDGKVTDVSKYLS